MLSFIIPARNAHQFTANCLDSVLLTVRKLGMVSQVEYILIDDCSDDIHGIQKLFTDFKAECGSFVDIERMPKWSHYVGSFARGMQLAKGNNLFLLSNDMVLTPDFLRTVLAVSTLDPNIGIVRGRSRHCDSHPNYNLRPLLGPRCYEDVESFSAEVARYHGLTFQVDVHLSGDAVLIRRELVDAIGGFDKQFFGYMGDPDYGIRARRAGYKLVCAMGAWLHHEGGGHIISQAEQIGKAPIDLLPDRMALVQKDWLKFRAKWDMSLPEQYDRSKQLWELVDFEKLIDMQPNIS